MSADDSYFRPWGARGSIDQALRQLVLLARSDEASRLLGVEGILEGQLDAAFLHDPLGWLASDIATALRTTEEDPSGMSGEAASAPLLSTLVAEYRLCRVLLGEVDEIDLARRVRATLEEN